MFSEEELQSKIKRIDDMTDKLWVQRRLLPRIKIKTILDNIPVTLKDKSSSLIAVMQEFLSPKQPSSRNANLLLTDAQKTTLKRAQEKEQKIINSAINQINQLFKEDTHPSEQALITLLESHRKLLFSSLTDQNGNTLLEVAQQAYRKISQNPAATEPEWKHHERKMNIPFRTAPLNETVKNSPTPTNTPTQPQSN